MRQADPICMWCALADADRPVRCDARRGPTRVGAAIHTQYLAGDVARARRRTATAALVAVDTLFIDQSSRHPPQRPSLPDGLDFPSLARRT